MDRKNYLTLFFTSIGLLLSQLSVAQNIGFEQDDQIKISGITTDAQIATLSPGQKQTAIIYYDGLGRPLQSVAEQASPLLHDMIQPVVYDNLGRQTTGYLPYADESANATGSYRSNAIATDQPAFYNQTTQYVIASDAAPYNQQVFENSPLQRLLSAGTVGAGFQPASGQHYKTVTYRYNGSTDGNIMVWNTDGTYTSGTYYANNTLAVADGKDEDNIETLSFTDLIGHVVLKRQILSGGNLDTYYIYNNAGMTTYVIPPKAIALMLTNGNYSLTQLGVNRLIFKYVYDTMGRIVERTVPGKGVEYIVYDPINRPVLSQDTNMRVNNQWIYIKYDVKGRVVNTGVYSDATHNTRTAMQTYVNGLASSYATTWYESRTTSGTFIYYTENVFPLAAANPSPQVFSYYDDYDVDNNGTANFTYSNQSLSGEMGATTAPIKGMPTVTLVRNVGSGIAGGQWLTKVIFYDKRGNPIQVKSANHVYFQGTLITTDMSTMVADFMGVPQITKVSKQTAATAVVTVQTNLTYDHMYRVKSVSQAYNGGASSIVASYTYNELGQVVSKNLGNYTSGLPANLNLNTTYTGTNSFTATNSITLSPGFSAPSGSTFNAAVSSAYLQTVDMRYNIRGQLLSINNSKLSNDGGVTNGDVNDLFGITMLYDKTDANLTSTPSYSGRLSAVKWMSSNGSGGTSMERAFSYYYDQLGRDTSAIYSERAAASSGSFTTTHGWDENRISYDQNGNTKTLYRNATTQGSGGHAAIDNLSYTYSTTNPNQLVSVSDASASSQGFVGGTGTYTYDGNGNLTNEPYKGLSSITYDLLNKTDKISFTSSANRYIDYTYDSGGNLLRKRQFDNVGGVATLQNTTDYIDGFVYVTAGAGAPVLQYFPMPEGRVVNSAGTFIPTYTISDQQGNVRVEFDNTGTGGTVHLRQENSYYAYGLIMPGSTITTPANPNKTLYNGGSEWQNDFSNLPDYYMTANRNFDAALGRFIGVDPMAESTESMTSYHYANDNPVLYNDPLGNEPSYLGYSPMQILSLQEMEERRGHGPHHSHSVTNFFNGGIDQDLLAEAQSGDPVALQLYVQMYGSTVDFNDITNNPNDYYTADHYEYYQPGQLSETARIPVEDPNMVFTVWAFDPLGGKSIDDFPDKEPDMAAGGSTVTTLDPVAITVNIDNAWAQSVTKSYTGRVTGEEGIFNTTNVTVGPRGYGTDYSRQVSPGFKLGVGTDGLGEGLSLMIGFGNSTYSLGAAEDGITWGSYVTSDQRVTGHITNFAPTPLTGIVHAVIGLGTYMYNNLGEIGEDFEEAF